MPSKRPHALTDDNKEAVEVKEDPDKIIDNDRAKLLKARYGYVQPDANTQLHQYLLHFKVDQRAVNQGMCFFNTELNTYYVKARKLGLPDQLPKELVMLDLERLAIHQGHTHIEFYMTGLTSWTKKIR